MLASQSGQYFPRLDFGTNTPSQTAQRFKSLSRKISASSVPFSDKRNNSKKPDYRDGKDFPVRFDERTPGTQGGSKAGFTAFERPEDGGTHEAEIEKIKIVFLAILRDLKKDMDNGE